MTPVPMTRRGSLTSASLADLPIAPAKPLP